MYDAVVSLTCCLRGFLRKLQLSFLLNLWKRKYFDMVYVFTLPCPVHIPVLWHGIHSTLFCSYPSNWHLAWYPLYHVLLVSQYFGMVYPLPCPVLIPVLRHGIPSTLSCSYPSTLAWYCIHSTSSCSYPST